MHNSMICAIVLTIALLTGCQKQKPQPAIEELIPAETIAQAPAPIKHESPPPTPIKSEAEKLLESMSIEEKAGQLFMPAFRREVELTVAMRAELSRFKPAGVVLFADNVRSKEQLSRLIAELKDSADIPLLIAVDEEGGRVSRIDSLYDKLPPAAETASEEEAFERGKIIGSRLSELGFNMALAPVADINTNPQNSVIGDRAFSSEPLTAAKYVSAAVRGIQSTGVLSVIKHFPGHGDTLEDSHFGAAIAEHDLDRLRQMELLPFAAPADGVMIGHVSLPNVTGNHLPATFSGLLVTDILRGELAFDGLVISDAMDMGAITNLYSSGEAALLAIEAGIDIVLMPENLSEAYSAVLDALANGRLSEKRLDESVLRILNLKL